MSVICVYDDEVQARKFSALTYTNNSCANLIRFLFLLQFRNVIEPPEEIPRWTEEHVASFLDFAIDLSLQPIDDNRLYEKCKVSLGEQRTRRNRTGSQTLERLNENIGVRNDHDVENSIGSDRRSIVSRVEQFFSNATQADSKLLYIYNCESPPQGVVSCLSVTSGHLDPRKNSRIEKMLGINTSMFYIGGCTGSFTELHVEDSIADSANMGKVKIWMIIDRQEYARINEIVAQKWKDFSDANGDNARLSAERCVLPLHHKNLVLTPRFLDEHKIRYEFVLQNAGDLLYIRYGILHQVINVGLNVAEAINVGSDAWNFGNELKMLCPCDDCQLDHVATNTDVGMSVNVGKPRIIRMRDVPQNF